MNPGYAGRSNLPENLKKLFRSVAMTKPDDKLIAQVLLFTQGFTQAETLANKVVPFFRLCKEQLSSQSHYDFGLRTLKSVLVCSGHLKRSTKGGQNGDDIFEQQLLVQSIQHTVAPKLVQEDVDLLQR
jgi:dynein heavy chain 1